MSPRSDKHDRKGGSRRGGSPVTRTAELAEKRGRRSSRFRLFAFLGLLLVLVLAGAYQFWLRDSSLVSIKNLEVVGVTDSTKEGKQIDQAVRTAMGQMTTLNIDPQALRDELARFPRVAHTEIETSLPDSATVTVEMRDDGSIFGEGSGALLIATDGTVLGAAAGQEYRLPRIVDGDPMTSSDGEGEEAEQDSIPAQATQAPVVGETLTGRALTQALVLGAAPPELRSHVQESVMTPEGAEVRFKNGLEMLFGDSSHADQKWRAAAALISDPGFDMSSYVDLSVPRRPAVSTPEQTEPVPE